MTDWSWLNNSDIQTTPISKTRVGNVREARPQKIRTVGVRRIKERRTKAHPKMAMYFKIEGTFAGRHPLNVTTTETTSDSE